MTLPEHIRKWPNRMHPGVMYPSVYADEHWALSLEYVWLLFEQKMQRENVPHHLDSPGFWCQDRARFTWRPSWRMSGRQCEVDVPAGFVYAKEKASYCRHDLYLTNGAGDLVTDADRNLIKTGETEVRQTWHTSSYLVIPDDPELRPMWIATNGIFLKQMPRVDHPGTDWYTAQMKEKERYPYF